MTSSVDFLCLNCPLHECLDGHPECLVRKERGLPIVKDHIRLEKIFKKRAYRREYYKRNKDKFLPYAKKWKAENADRYREWKRIYARGWRERHKERLLEYGQEYREKNKDRERERQRLYRLAHIDEIREKDRKRYRRKKEEKLAKNRD